MVKNKVKKILFIFGTRPEAIKCAPLILKMKRQLNSFKVLVCNTGQHKEMTDQVLNFFNIAPDYDLELMQKDQSLFDVTKKCLEKLEKVVKKIRPDILFVQGDTTSAFIGALAGFYERIPVAHLEAGLRTDDIYAPFPEEANRKFVSAIASFHFAPTQSAARNLKRENVKSNIWVVGNTVIDALLLALKRVRKDEKTFEKKFPFIGNKNKIVLVTGHRRENFGLGFRQIAQALKIIASENTLIVYPVHLNPNVKKPIYQFLGKNKNIHLLPPVNYPELIWLLDKSHLVLTDSGGIQEEAPTLGKPVLVMREVTERPEGVQEGTAKIVGTDSQKIVENVKKLLNNEKTYRQMAKARNPYGDGKASDKIIKILKNIK